MSDDASFAAVLRPTSAVASAFFRPASASPAAYHAKSQHYRGTSLIRNSLTLGPYSKPLPRVI